MFEYKLLFKLLLYLSFIIILNCNAISLEQAVYQALNTNPEIKDKVYALVGVKKERDMALSAYYPRLNISYGIGVAQQKIVPSFNVQTGERVLRTEQTVTASMNLFSGFNTYHDAQSQKHRENAAQSYLNEYKTSIVMRTVESYVNMIKQKAILQISKEIFLSHQEIYKKLEEYINSGMGKSSDLKFASARLTLSEVNAVVHENNFIQLKIAFETVFGSVIDVDSLEEPFFDYVLPKSLENAANIAFKNNSSIQVGIHNTKSARSNYKRSKSSYYPSLDLEISKSILKETGPFEYSVESSNAMIYLSYSLYNGFMDKAIIEKEFTIYLQNNEYLLFTKRDIVSQLGISWVASIKIQEQLELLEKLRMFSKKTLEDYYEEFGIGRRTFLDISSVKDDYDNARQSYETAKYDLLLSKFRILNAMGVLEAYFLAKTNSLNLILKENYDEEKSVNNIIQDINDKFKNKENFFNYDNSRYKSFDSMLKTNTSNDMSDLDN
ncbi:MAG: hypothetical protein COB17_06540 [Sulfurimonas sp.]|nr:MAG: hypothetical protein COB17_06540 [Sulfurimonas sp.]